MQKFSWDDLKVVVAVGEYGNLSRASDALAMNHSTLFRRLGAIESALGISLFLRRRTQYVPTVAGAELISLGHRIDDDVTAVMQNITEEIRGFSGEIRITTSDALLNDYLNPLIASFASSNPQISFQVSIGNEAMNLFDGGADVAFRATSGAPEHLSGRKVGTAVWAVYGLSRQWKDKAVTLECLKEQRWASFSHSMSKLKAFSWIENTIPAQNIVFRGDSVLSVASALSSGIGIGLLPCMHGDQARGLVQISPVLNDISEELWFLAHPDVRKSAKIREFMNHCIQYITENRSRISGIAP
ncbi:transcriptional regulator [Serratia sp. FGI94]|uniref:LysR family transcriptional regulator n=1 Tax=Serratia sp. FGI94 TaxID=671990 RepID=UPI0002A72B8E|nr:LysR family transcriptional regulator [Serratia sp. FGI94]AGB83991.1 transcriptional regulator [Serratia sp. FGI94]